MSTRVPAYRTPEWRERIDRALENGAVGIDDAMQWAYDMGIGAGAEYEALERRADRRSEGNPATGNHTHRYDWKIHE